MDRKPRRKSPATSKSANKSTNTKKPVKKIVKRRKKKSPLKRTLTVIGTTFISLFLVAVITGSIVATALTVYIMNFADDSMLDIEIDKLKLNYTTIIYAYDKNGNEVEIKRLHNEANRIWVDLDQVPRHVRDAFICAEDQRFLDHDGIDWKRTFASFANLFLHFYDTKQGGSSITQQLVKNVTGDDKQDISRKLREIFRAMNMEKHYTKDDILEAYLNYIGLASNSVSGVQAASDYYFGKDVSELTIAEAACIAAIPKNPPVNDPYKNYDKNAARKLYVLEQMYDNGAISYEEFEAAKEEEIVLRYASTDEARDKNEEALKAEQISNSYFVDAVIEDVIKGIQEKTGMDRDSATKKLYSGGYRIYTTVDLDMQTAVEKKYENNKAFTSYTLDEYPQSSFVAMDYSGHILAIVGGIGEKTARGWNFATMEKRSPGSAMKPVGVYAPALNLDMITWSTMVKDQYFKIIEEDGEKKKFPQNYSKTYSNSYVPVYKALERSLNTIPVELLDRLGPKTSYDFLTTRLGYTSLVASRVEDNGRVFTDIDYSPLALGGLTDGVTTVEQCAAYQIFGNGGVYYKPTTFTKVIDPEDNVVLEYKPIGIQAIQPDAAYVMNRMLKQVVEGPNGTGTAAKLSKVEVVGKTGTSQNNHDIYFVGCTPDYVSAVWYGYKQRKDMGNIFYSSAQIWKNVFGEYANNNSSPTFKVDPDVIEARFDLNTGLLAGENTKNTSIGYYRPSNLPRSGS